MKPTFTPFCLGNHSFKSSGIGLYIALHLVRRGAKVYIAARSEEKAEHAIARMEQEGMGEHPGQLVWLPIDLTDPHKARAAAEWFLKRESRLDILGAWSLNDRTHYVSLGRRG